MGGETLADTLTVEEAAPLLGKGDDDMGLQKRGGTDFVTDDQLQKAQEWGVAHGYDGKAGGWIYSPSGTPVSPDWAAFYRTYREAITTPMTER